MKAYLRSVRIAPKKASIVAKMLRRKRAEEGMAMLSRTNKKAARIFEKLLQSAIANATHNDGQNAKDLVIRTVVVNKSLGLQRGVPMARGRMRPMTKWMSHLTITLGVEAEAEKEAGKATKPKKKSAPAAPTAKTEQKTEAKASQKSETPVEQKEQTEASASSASESSSTPDAPAEGETSSSETESKPSAS